MESAQGVEKNKTLTSCLRHFLPEDATWVNHLYLAYANKAIYITASVFYQQNKPLGFKEHHARKVFFFSVFFFSHPRLTNYFRVLPAPCVVEYKPINQKECVSCYFLKIKYVNFSFACFSGSYSIFRDRLVFKPLSQHTY